MDIQGELRWIQQELQNVKDPDIITMIKKYTGVQKENHTGTTHKR